MKLRLTLAAAAFTCAAVSFGDATFVTHPYDIGANDFIAWDQFGSDYTLIASGTHGHTNLGLGFTIKSVNDGTGVDDGGISEDRTEGVSWNGIFTGGARVLYFHNSHQALNSDLEIVFDKAVGGVGYNVQSNAFGAFDATVAAYTGDFQSGGTFINNGTVSGLNDGTHQGTAPFEGFVSQDGDIGAIYLATFMHDGSDDQGLGIGNVLIRNNAVPEPASMAALAIGAAALMRRKAKK